MQEIRVQASDIEGRFEEMAGLKGHFHFAEKKGYAGTAIYTKHAPSDVVVGWGDAEFDAEGRYLELRFDTPKRKLSIISCYFPSGSSGEERQAAKFRFLKGFFPHLNALKREREFILCGDINIAHQEIDLKNWRGNQKNSGFLPEERAWMTKLLDRVRWRGAGRRLPPAQARDHGRRLHLVEQPRPGLREQRRVAARLPPGDAELAALAREEQIFKTIKFSDHAPITVDYDFAL